MGTLSVWSQELLNSEQGKVGTLTSYIHETEIPEPGSEGEQEAVSAIENALIALEGAKKVCKETLAPEIEEAHGVWKFLTGIRKTFFDAVGEGIDDAQLKLGNHRAKVVELERLEAIAYQKAREAEIEADRDIYAESLEAEGHDATEIRNAPIVVPKEEVPSLQPKTSKGAQLRTNWKYEVIDESLVPRHLLCVDEKAVAALVRAKKDRCVDELKAFGIRVYPEIRHYVKKG